MKTSLKNLFVAVIIMMFCLPATAFAKPHSNHSGGSHHQQMRNDKSHHKTKHHSPPPVQQCGMSDSQFSSFISLVKNTSFRSNKLEVVKAAAASNSFTVAQVIQVMDAVNFSSDKVEVAAALYDSLCDYDNWYQVYGQFIGSWHIEDLKAKIGQ